MKKEAKNAVTILGDKINNFTAFVDLLATLRFKLILTTRKRFVLLLSMITTYMAILENLFAKGTHAFP